MTKVLEILGIDLNAPLPKEERDEMLWVWAKDSFDRERLRQAEERLGEIARGR